MTRVKLQFGLMCHQGRLLFEISSNAIECFIEEDIENRRIGTRAAVS